MTLEQEYLLAADGVREAAAAQFAHDLTLGYKASFKAGYSRANAIRAAIEVFYPESPEQIIRRLNEWPV